MKIARIGGSRVAYSDAAQIIEKHYAYEAPNLSQCKVLGTKLISKADAQKKLIAAPYSMAKLLTLLDQDEYHSGCIDALVMATVLKCECKNSQVNAWLKAAQYPACEDETTLLAELMRYYLACGNGFLIKMRNAQGAWVGLERLLPSEAQIVERYDAYGFATPDYIQVKNQKRVDFRYEDIIHLKKATHQSFAWGLACLPIAINIEILKEIKTYDYNNFKNGLMADYFVIVEGGTLRDGTVTDENGNEVITDAFAEIEKVLQEVKGNAKSHSTVLIESENKDAKIRLEPLRQQVEGGFLNLKKDLREGILAYHRVPARIVSQLIPGQLGGDNTSDMVLFYHFVVKPLQNRLALALANEFNYEYKGWNVSPTDFNFGDLTEVIKTDDEKLFSQLRNN